MHILTNPTCEKIAPSKILIIAPELVAPENKTISPVCNSLQNSLYVFVGKSGGGRIPLLHVL